MVSLSWIGKHFLDLDWLCAFFHQEFSLTHIPLVSESGRHLFRQWVVACLAPSHYINQHWVIVNWTLRGTNFIEILIKIKHLIMKMHLKISPVKWRPFYPGENELKYVHSICFGIGYVPTCWCQANSWGQAITWFQKLCITRQWWNNTLNKMANFFSVLYEIALKVLVYIFPPPTIFALQGMGWKNTSALKLKQHPSNCNDYCHATGKQWTHVRFHQCIGPKGDHNYDITEISQYWIL